MTLPNRPRICTFESRRADEMRSLIERLGGIAVCAPSMQEVAVEENHAAVRTIEQIVARNVDYMILLTGVGTEAMLQVAASQNLEEPLRQAMQQIPQLIRGPKPAAVLGRLGIKYAVKAPEPNTSKDLLQAIDAAGIVMKGRTVAVQEYGVPSADLNQGLTDRGATVLSVPVYRWALPDDIGPLESAVDRTIADEFDILLFTSAQQARHVLLVAKSLQKHEEWLSSANRTLVGSIGPTCTETLMEVGLTVHFEASPPKMGPLVRGAIEALRESH